MAAPIAFIGKCLYEETRKTEHLHVTADCIGCLHRSPKFAIQYGNGKTKEHGQYTNPHVKV